MNGVAPLWRRFGAIVYDALVLAGLCVGVAMLMTLIAPEHPLAMRAAIFGVTLAFFVWFWTHGGQTVGMRAWRVRVVRESGERLTPWIAAVRYLFALLPLLVALYAVSIGGWMLSPLALAGFTSCPLDPRRRALHDLAAGTLIVSAQGAQSQQGNQHEQDSRQPG